MSIIDKFIVTASSLGILYIVAEAMWRAGNFNVKNERPHFK